MRGFRVWLKRESRWLKNDEFKINPDGSVSTYGIFVNKEGLVRRDFIGFCYRSGEQIFEGDIVLFPDGGHGRHFLVCYGGPYDDAGFGITAKNAGGLSDSPIDSWDRLNPRYAEKLTKVGNIHENPELLES